MNKPFFIVIIFVCLVLTGGIIIQKPVMHKQFSLSVIDYLIKFNTDGSVTTTKQTTTTQLKQVGGN
ncbi:hypothetical protein IJ818_06375 [bacterium]|nr:hypothetical protein [bacterium]